MNKLMIRHTMDKPLPYDAEVEWIGGTAFSFIITDTPAAGFVTHKAKLVNTNVSPTVEFLHIGNSSKEYLNYRLGNSLKLYENNANNRSLQFDVCGNVYTRYMQPFDNSAGSRKNFILQGNASDYVYSYFIQIFDNQRNLVLDLIPVRVGQTGCLYDKVNNKLYYATNGVPDFGPDYNPFAYQYLTFVPLEDSTFSFAKRGTGNDIEYSIDGGAWTSLASEANTPTVGAGHNIRWRAELTPSSVSGNQGIGTFSATGLYDAMGNTMSLLYGDNFVGQTTLVGTYTFYNLWYRDAYINRTNNLILPAIKMKSYCYQAMFRECTNLLTAPNLPATTLATRCYANMFIACTNLLIAPELPATTLTDRCYLNLFYNCSNIANIKMLATNISATSCLQTWLYGVASTGTFVKNAAMTTLPTGSSGIPSGWTVVDNPSTITT